MSIEGASNFYRPPSDPDLKVGALVPSAKLIVGAVTPISEAVAEAREAAYKADFISRRGQIIADTIRNNRGK